MRWLATVAASRVVADLLLASPGFEDRVVPSWSVSANCNYVFSTLPDGRVAGALLSDHRAGGAAARPWGDGISHSGQQTSFSSNVANVESVEEKLPVLYLHRRALADSGGPGRYRGGLTAESALVPFGVDDLLLNSTNTAGTDPTNASGIAGGYPGAGSQVYLARGADVLGAFARGEWPELDRQTLLHLPSKAQATIGATDALAFHPPGGGGFADPLDRPTAEVAEDLRLGRVTPAGAREIYAVVLDPDRADGVVTDARAGASDADATAAEREHRRSARREETRTRGNATREDLPACPTCGSTDPVPVLEEPLRAAGPWLAERWQGHSPNFFLALAVCPICGTLRDVTERLRRRDPDAPPPTYQIQE